AAASRDASAVRAEVESSRTSWATRSDLSMPTASRSLVTRANFVRRSAHALARGRGTRRRLWRCNTREKAGAGDGRLAAAAGLAHRDDPVPARLRADDPAHRRRGAAVPIRVLRASVRGLLGVRVHLAQQG